MKRLFLVLATVFISGCSSEFAAYLAKPDPLSPGTITRFSSAIAIKGIDFMDPSHSSFSFYRSSTGSDTSWWIMTSYTGEDWLFVKKLSFMIDGKRYDLDNDGRPARSVGSGSVFEVNSFPLPDSLRDAFLRARSAFVRLSGDNYFNERTLDKTDIANIKWFFNYLSSLRHRAVGS